MSMMPFIFGNTTYYSKAEADARIAELEAEVKRLNEAGKVLAREVAEWRTHFADASGLYENVRHGINNNPTAAAWVREVSK